MGTPRVAPRKKTIKTPPLNPIDELDKLFGDSAPYVHSQLLAVIERHLRSQVIWDRYYNQKPRGKRAKKLLATGIDTIATSLGQLIKNLNGVDPDTREYLRTSRSLLDLARGSNSWDEVIEIRNRVQEVLQRLPNPARVFSVPAQMPQVRRRGRQMNDSRWQLCYEIAVVLQFNGVRVTNYSDGKFAQALKHVITAVEGSSPTNLSFFMGPISRMVRKLDPEELRSIAELLGLPHAEPA